jgi:hypothetical protein
MSLEMTQAAASCVREYYSETAVSANNHNPDRIPSLIIITMLLVNRFLQSWDTTLLPSFAIADGELRDI